MASKNINEYLEEETVSSNFEDSGSSDWEPYKIQGNILAYDTDDEENNHNIITSSYNNIKVNHNNMNTDISVIFNVDTVHHVQVSFSLDLLIYCGQSMYPSCVNHVSPLATGRSV
jgi:hypothetical protein